VAVFDGLEHLSPLKPEIARGTDLLIVRELTGGIYFGKPSQNGPDRGVSTDVYERHEVERIARTAFEAARLRRGRVTNVDKANVLDVSQFWRDVVVGSTRPSSPTSSSTTSTSTTPPCSWCATRAPFDVVVTANLFGDILSDLAACSPARSASSRRRASAAPSGSTSPSTAAPPTSPVAASPTPPARCSPPR
jgi:3-isopropylmalate dehydrogenase